jgi:hypothetical protein
VADLGFRIVYDWRRATPQSANRAAAVVEGRPTMAKKKKKDKKKGKKKK